MLSESLEKRTEGWGDKKRQKPPRAAPRTPLIFTHGNFFENKLIWKTDNYGKSTQTARLP